MILNNGISKTTKVLLICGQIGCVLFALLFFIQGQLREGYYPLRFAVSSLSIGQYGWVQRSNFFVSGILIFLSSFGFYKGTSSINGQLWTSRFFGTAGIGLVGAGIFSSNPVYGYPATEPLRVAQYTVSGHLHDFFSSFFFFGILVTCFKMRNRFKAIGEHNSATVASVAGYSILIGLFLFDAGFMQVPFLVDVAGLLQRLTIITALSWLTFLLGTVIKNSKQIYY